MRHGLGRTRRVWMGLACLVGASALGGCGMTPRDEFFQAQAITFKAMPGDAGASGSGLAGGGTLESLAAR
jgi:hypothetical protein